MNKLKFFILFLLVGIFINGCSANSSEEIGMEKLIIADVIKKVEISQGSTEEIKKVNLNDTDEISDLMTIIKDIPVKQLGKAEDAEFITPKIVDNDMINVIIYSDEKTWAGNFLIWPDGYIYIVDIDSMLSNQRTISYLSISKYPELYELLDNQIVILEDQAH